MFHEAGIVGAYGSFDEVLIGLVGGFVVIGLVILLDQAGYAEVAFGCLVDGIVILGFVEEHVACEFLVSCFFCIAGHFG